MRAFYDGLNQVDSTFSSKVIIFPNNSKNYLEIEGPLILGASDTVIKLCISGSEKIASPCFHAFFFLGK